MINLKEIFPPDANDGDTAQVDDVVFTYSKEKSAWTHESFDEADRFDYEIIPLYTTTVVYISKTLMNEKNWWHQIS